MTASTVDQVMSLLRSQAVAGVVRRVAPSLGADPDLLLDSRALARATGSLDPESPAFAAGVTQAAREAVAAEPARFGARSAPVPAAAATPAPGPALPVPDDGSRQWTMADVGRASPAEFTAAIDRGQLRSLGYAPARRHYR